MTPPPFRRTALSFTLCLALLSSAGLSAKAGTAHHGAAPLLPTSELAHLPAAAVAADGMDGDEARVVGRLLVDLERPSPRVGVLFDLDPDWHLYWRNPGEIGLPTELDWDTPGAQAGPIAWPAPRAFDDLATGLQSYGYDGQVLLWSPLHGRPDQVAVSASLLVCRHKCIPASLTLSRSFDAATPAVHAAAERAVFDHYQARVPTPAASAGVTVEAAYSRSVLRPGDPFEAALVVVAEAAPDAGAPFFPELDAAEGLGLEVVGSLAHPSRPGSWIVSLRGEVDEGATPDAIPALAGVLTLAGPDGETRHLTFSAPVPLGAPGSASVPLGLHWLEAPSAQASNMPPPDSSGLGLLRVVLLALLGGLILNGMPCVLPVLGIKVCSVAELAREDRATLRHHGFAYAAGVLSSMAALAAVVVVLQAAGTRVGWGFQFQEPLFVAIVASVVVLFALNLFGVFEINVSAGGLSKLATERQGTSRSFFDGLLAVVLATPCTAPFLGTAVGFAFAGGTATILLIFLAIGAGLAAPYTLICLVPAWARFLPRPGAWMIRLRAGLGFLLMATAVWLLWIFGRSAGVDGVASLLALLVALSFGAWLLGWIQTLARPRAALGAFAALALLAVGGLNTVRVNAAPTTGSRAAQSTDRWAAYDAAAIARTLAAGRPAFVSFTADWCITCKVNEAGALSDPRVDAAMAAGAVDRFRGDWTMRDEAIRSELARHGRAGVPLYLVYDPRRPDAPLVLPELLSVDGVVAALEGATRGLAVAAAH